MRYVQYVGLAHQRIISPSDWRSVGLNAGTVVWNAGNGFAVPLDLFTEDQLRLAIEPDSGFVITGEGQDQDTEFVPVRRNQDMTPAEARQATENPVDVVTMADGGVRVSTDAAPTGNTDTVRRDEALGKNKS